MKRIVSIFVCFTLLAVLFIGCSGGNGENVDNGTVPPADIGAVNDAITTGEETTITFMILDAFTGGEDAAIYEAVKAFEDSNPGIKVIVEPIPSSNLKDKFTSLALAGGGPDVVALDTGGWITDAAAIGLLADISDRVNPIVSQFQPGSLKAGEYGGAYYAVPWYLNNAGLYYNKTILDDAKIEYVPMTWEEFEDAMGKIEGIGKKVLSIFAKPSYVMYPFFFQNGSDVIDTSGDIPVSVLDTPEALEAFTFFTDIHNKYNGFPESGKEALTWDQCYAPFIQEECAFMICGDWGNAAVSSGNPDLDYGIAPLPAGKAGATVMGGWSLSINRNTVNTDAAWKFVEYLTAAEQNGLLLSYGRIGARVDIDASALVSEYPHLEVFVDQASVTYPRPGVKDLFDCDDAISTAFQEVYLNGANPAEALLGAHEKINQLMTEKYS